MTLNDVPGGFMDKIYADLHVHSYFSNGSMSPAEIVEAAVEISKLRLKERNEKIVRATP